MSFINHNLSKFLCLYIYTFLNSSSKSIPEGTISSPTDGTVIPILGYASELLPTGQISRHEKIVNVPFQLPIASKSSIIEEWSSKDTKNIFFFVKIFMNKVYIS